jgi:hypothetical protein
MAGAVVSGARITAGALDFTFNPETKMIEGWIQTSDHATRLRFRGRQSTGFFHNLTSSTLAQDRQTPSAGRSTDLSGTFSGLIGNQPVSLQIRDSQTGPIAALNITQTQSLAATFYFTAGRWNADTSLLSLVGPTQSTLGGGGMNKLLLFRELSSTGTVLRGISFNTATGRGNEVLLTRAL